MPWKDPKSKEAIEYQRKWWEENKHKKDIERKLKLEIGKTRV